MKEVATSGSRWIPSWRGQRSEDEGRQSEYFGRSSVSEHALAEAVLDEFREESRNLKVDFDWLVLAPAAGRELLEQRGLARRVDEAQLTAAQDEGLD